MKGSRILRAGTGATWSSTKQAGAPREGRSRQRLDDPKGAMALAGGKCEPASWPAPKPLPNGLAPVQPFSGHFLPNALRPWVEDIAERLQCPPDYVAVSAITALGSVIGRRVGIKPQARTDWIVIPNFWSVFIGPPGMLKSPAMLEGIKPLHRLEAEAAKENEIARQAYATGLDAYMLRKQVRIALEKKALIKDKICAGDLDVGHKPQEPIGLRYRTNDTTYEAVGELLTGNPNGILIERDELVSLFQHLDREEQSVARGFYLSGWSGTQPYTFDRIVRGQIHIDAVCLSVLGNTQPSRIIEYVRRANADGAGGDGLIQRFGLMVWPDSPSAWKNVDDYPDSEARQRAWGVFARMSELTPETVRGSGASKGEFDQTFSLRFDDDALAEFVEWRTDLEGRLRSHALPAAIEGHFAKYRKLVPALALINHLADDGNGAVSRPAVEKAIAFSRYLESHARRVYSAADLAELATGKAILAHIRKGDLGDGFTARDVHQRGWSNLTDRAQVQAGLDFLVDLDYLSSNTNRSYQPGRPKVTFAINPRGRA